jgi:hypothetical protein
MGGPISESLNIAGDTQSMQWSYITGGELVTTSNGYDSAGNLELISISILRGKRKMEKSAREQESSTNKLH